MSRQIGAGRPLAALACVLLLTGCISVLPKDKPAQTYRFGVLDPVTAPAASGPRFTVRAEPLSFDRAAGGNRILTVEGLDTAYIKGGRWVISAFLLYDDSVASAFAHYPGPARLLARAEPFAGDYAMKLVVRTFEARYLQGRQAAPTIVVAVSASLDGRGKVELSRQKTFEASVPASANTVTAIAAAFDTAVNAVNRDLVGWVGARGEETAAHG